MLKPQLGRGRVGRTLGELVLIVVGVLLAFWVESRWSERQEAARRETAAVVLGEELRRTRTEVEQLLGTEETYIAAIDTMVLMSLGNLPVPSPSHVHQLLWRATAIGDFAVSRATLEGIVGEGLWRDPERPELQVELSRLAAALTALNDAADFRHDGWMSVEPYLAARIDFRLWDVAFLGGWDVDLPASEEEALRSLLSDRRFMNELKNVLWYRYIARSAFEDVLERIDAALAVLAEAGG